MGYSKALLWIVCLGPAGWLAWEAIVGGLGANPIEALTHTTGDWALRLLFVTLAVTPLRRLTGWNSIIRYRRMLGLFAFFYASLHFLSYVVLDHFFALGSILEDVTTRRYVTVGFAGFVLLIPLAVTSTQRMIRRLGGRRWRALHRLVYVSAIAGVVHYLWLVRIDVRPPVIYALILSLLLGARLWRGHGQPARKPVKRTPSLRLRGARTHADGIRHLFSQMPKNMYRLQPQVQNKEP